LSGVLFFKLEEEEKPALLLHLLKLFVKDCFFVSVFGLGCLLVVGCLQAAKGKSGLVLPVVKAAMIYWPEIKTEVCCFATYPPPLI
jgi:hypothetical protein